jgi:hypothetical protein
VTGGRAAALLALPWQASKARSPERAFFFFFFFFVVFFFFFVVGQTLPLRPPVFVEAALSFIDEASGQGGVVPVAARPTRHPSSIPSSTPSSTPSWRPP